MERVFKAGNCNICYNDIGSGKPLVLLHGYLETSRTWEHFAERLSGEFRVIIPDLPGHGNSSMAGEVLTMEIIAGVINELTDSLGFEKFCLVGHSLGGYATLAFADLYPSKLSGYVLFHSQPLADSPEATIKREHEIALAEEGKKDLFYPGNIKKMFAPPNLDKLHEQLRRATRIASSISGEAITSVLRGMMKRPARISVIEKGEIPCLWILGAMDNYIDFQLVKSKVRLPVNAELVILKNSGHLGFIEEEDLSVKILSSFIRKLN
jgi:pimeloyl-ACP methyl ester carboxylesterase